MLDSFTSPTTPETRVLLDSARALVHGPSGTSEGEAIAEGMDWRALQELAGDHGLLPAVCRRVKACASVPEIARREFESYWTMHSHRCVFLCGELARLLKRLNGRGIRGVALKGPAVSTLAYGDAYSRSFGDLDILVPEDRFDAAVAEVRVAGYRPAERYARERPSDQAVTFVHSQTRVVVDIHPRVIGSRFSYSLAHDKSIWDRLTTVTLGCNSVPTLSREDSILHMCTHEAKHRWVRLEGICCIAGLARKDVDWEVLLRRAHELKVERQMLVSLLLGRELGLDLPRAVRRMSESDPGGTALAREVACSLLHAAPRPFSAATAFSRDLRVRSTWADRIRVIGFTPNERDRAFLPLPHPLRVLYFPLRPVRLVCEHGCNLFRTLLNPGANTPHA